MPGFGAAARHPDGEIAAVVVAAGVRIDPTLRVDRAAKLALEGDQRIFEQAALLQVGDQRVRKADPRPSNWADAGARSRRGDPSPRR